MFKLDKIFWIIAFFSFHSAYKSGNSIILSLAITLLIEICFYIGGSILWKLEIDKGYRILLILGFYSLVIAGFYGISKVISYYSATKVVSSHFSEEDINNLKELYQLQKLMDAQYELKKIVEKLQSGIDDDGVAISFLINQLQDIDKILENPFMDKIEAEPFYEIRQIIVDTIRNSAIDNEIFLESFDRTENINYLCREIANNFVRVESYRILIEKGTLEYLKFFEDMLKTKQGRLNFKQLLLTKDLELQLLIIAINDKDLFEKVAIDLLERAELSAIDKDLLNFDAQKYIKNYLFNFLQTIEGRQQIVSDIQKINTITHIYIDALCKVMAAIDIEKISIKELKQRMKNIIHNDINDICKTIGKEKVSL